MCKIIILQPGYTLPYDMLETACYNNPHGYGLVLRDPKHNKLQLIKSGESALEKGNDPKEIYDLLKDNEDIERYLHLRWKTEGEISQENVQPFCSFHSDKRQVYFMHNGTLSNWKAPTTYDRWENGVKISNQNGQDKRSDSNRFNEIFLSPLLNRFEGANGRGDIEDPIFQTVLNKFWEIGSVNKGLLISSDQGYYLINKDNWKEIKVTDGSFWASNDTYFEKVIRGPVHEAREKERKEKEAAENRARFQNHNNNFGKKDSKTLFELKNILLQDKILLSANIKDLMADVDVYSEEGMASLKNMTAIEWETFLEKNKEDSVALLIHFTDEYDRLWTKYNKATSYLASLKEKEVRVG